MELRHLRYFLAVADELNFTRAAERLGIGQPPLSQQIKALEREIGAALFRRVAHGAELTAAGEAFLRSVRTIPGQATAAVTEAQRAARGETGALRIGFTGSAAFNARVPAAIRRYRNGYPDVLVSLEEANSNGLVAGLHSGDLDAAFIRPEAVDHDGLRITLIEREPLIAVLAAGRTSHSCSLDLTSMNKSSFIMMPRELGPTLYDATVAACRKAGFEPTIGQTAPQIASILALVAADFGVALVPASMREVALTGITYHDVSDSDANVSLALAHRRNERAPAALAFIKTVHETISR